MLENEPVVMLDSEPPRLMCSYSSEALSAISCERLEREGRGVQAALVEQMVRVLPVGEVADGREWSFARRRGRLGGRFVHGQVAVQVILLDELADANDPLLFRVEIIGLGRGDARVRVEIMDFQCRQMYFECHAKVTGVR